MPTAVKDAPVEAEPEAQGTGPLEGFNDGLAWERFSFRDVEYKVQELPIGEYDEIVRKATRKEKITDPDSGVSQEVDVVDQNLQSRMMLKACVVEPEKIDVTKLGTRLTVALNTVINRLHYGPEPDALRPPKKKDGDSSEEKPGNR